MPEKLGVLLASRQSVPDEIDVRYFCERYLRERLGVSDLNCASDRRGRLVATVMTPAVKQEVLLLIPDLAQAVKAHLQTDVGEIKVRLGV